MSAKREVKAGLQSEIILMEKYPFSYRKVPEESEFLQNSHISYILTFFTEAVTSHRTCHNHLLKGQDVSFENKCQSVRSLTAETADVSGRRVAIHVGSHGAAKSEGPSHPTDPCLQTTEALPNRHVLQRTLRDDQSQASSSCKAATCPT